MSQGLKETQNKANIFNFHIFLLFFLTCSEKFSLRFKFLTLFEITGVCSATEAAESNVLTESPLGNKKDELVIFVDKEEQLATELFKLFTELLSDDDEVVFVLLLVPELDELTTWAAPPRPCCCCTLAIRLKNSLYLVSTLLGSKKV